MGKIGTRLKSRVKHLILDPVDLEREKQDAGRKPRDLVLRIAQEFHPVAIAGVLRIIEIGEGPQPPENLV